MAAPSTDCFYVKHITSLTKNALEFQKYYSFILNSLCNTVSEVRTVGSRGKVDNDGPSGVESLRTSDS